MRKGLGRSWGPSAWHIFHTMSFNWNEKNINIYIQFFNLIKNTIPCLVCYTNFKKKINSPNLSINENCKSKEKMINWIIKMHNIINKSNQKKEYTLKEVENIYIKNNKVIIDRNHYVKFIREYIIFNIKIRKGNNAIRILAILAMLFPIKRVRNNLIKSMKKNKRKNIFLFVREYTKALK